MINVVCAPDAVFCVVGELADQTDQTLVDIELCEQLNSGDIEVPMRGGAVVIIVNNIELDVVVKEGALNWPDIKEEVKSEVSKEEGQVLASSKECVQSLASD